MAKIHTCEICNKKFTKQRINHPSRFCSRGCFYSWQRSDEAKEISRQKMIDRRENYLKKHGEPLGFSSIKNPSKSEDAKKRLKDARLGSKTSEFTKNKISKSMKLTLKNPEMRKKWSEASKGIVPTLETRIKISNARKNKFKSRAGLVTKLDKVYSRYIREKYSQDDTAVCITCNKVFEISNMDCGHYISRRFMSIRYDERNTHPQCVQCNRFEQGNIDVYTQKIIELYGRETLDELIELKNGTSKTTTIDLEAKLEHYSYELNKLNPKKYPYL